MALGSHRAGARHGEGHHGSHRVSVASLYAQGRHRHSVKVIHPAHPVKAKVHHHKARKAKVHKGRHHKKS